MVIHRGEVWWAALPQPIGSGPGRRRPVLVVQSDPFNRSRIRTAVVAAITTNTRLAEAPGNVLVEQGEGGLTRESVVNVSQVLTIDRSLLDERLGHLAPKRIAEIDTGLRLALGL